MSADRTPSSPPEMSRPTATPRSRRGGHVGGEEDQLGRHGRPRREPHPEAGGGGRPGQTPEAAADDGPGRQQDEAEGGQEEEGTQGPGLPEDQRIGVAEQPGAEGD